MFFRLKSYALEGLQVHPVDVEVDTGRGLPSTVVVGLPGKAIMESRDRVKTALVNSSMPYPRSKVTVNLTPADLRKEGPLYDLHLRRRGGGTLTSFMVACGPISFTRRSASSRELVMESQELVLGAFLSPTTYTLLIGSSPATVGHNV